jgi:DNA-binding IclR family transcriptional regulator
MNERDKESHERYIVPAVEQAMRILFQMAEAGTSHMTLTEIFNKAGVHKSKAFSILQTMKKFGVVQRGVDGRGYSLGPGLIGLSRRFLDNLRAPTLAEPFLKDLARKTGTTAALGLIADKNVFVASKHEGGRGVVVTMRVGHRFPISYGCHGKAIAAFLSAEDRNNLLKDKKLYFQGDPSRLDRAKLMEDLKKCRRDWYAEDVEETAPGLNAVASPVLGPNGYPLGYVVVLGLASAEATHETGPLAALAGQALSRQLGAPIDELLEPKPAQGETK